MTNVDTRCTHLHGWPIPNKAPQRVGFLTLHTFKIVGALQLRVGFMKASRSSGVVLGRVVWSSLCLLSQTLRPAGLKVETRLSSGWRLATIAIPPLTRRQGVGNHGTIFLVS